MRSVHVVSQPLESTVALVTVAPLGTPDSPVNYRGVAAQKPEGEEFSLYGPGAPDTVRCARPRFSSISFCSFLLNPNLDLFIGLC